MESLEMLLAFAALAALVGAFLSAEAVVSQEVARAIANFSAGSSARSGCFSESIVSSSASAGSVAFNASVPAGGCR